jgi:ferredoxin
MAYVSVKKLDDKEQVTAEDECKVEIIVGEVLFDSFSKVEYELPHGCLNGGCCSCLVEVLVGHEHLNFPKAKESETLTKFKENYERKHGRDSLNKREVRLSCQATIIKNADIVICPFK